MGAMTKSPDEADGAGKLEFARIIEVNFREYSVDVETIFTHKPYTDIPIGALYAHPDHGGGIYFMPEVGSHCYVMTSADGTQFVQSWMVNPVTRAKPILTEEGEVDLSVVDQGPNFAGKRPLMEPGDIMLATRDGNSVSVKRGGIVQIAATGLCQRMYIPLENLVRDVFQRYEAKSPLGEVIWGHATLEDGAVTDTGVLIQGSWKEKAQDTDFAVEIRIGQLDEDILDTEVDREHVFLDGKEAEGLGIGSGVLATNIGALSLAIFARGGDSVTYKMQVSREGELFILSKSHIHIETETFFLKLAQQGKVEFGASFVELISESGTLRAVVQQMVLDQIVNLTVVAATGQVSIGGVTLNMAGGIATLQGVLSVGGVGGQPVLTTRGEILSLLKDHKHRITVVGDGTFTTEASDTLGGIEAAKSANLKAS